MSLPRVEEEELDEGLLYDDEASENASATSSDDDDVPAAATEGMRASPDDGDMADESSAKSSLINIGLDVPEAGDEAGTGRLMGQVAHTVPNIRMGSSVPVSIPARWKKPDASPASPSGPKVAPGTFVPPHQLSHTQDFMFSFNGDDPSVAFKRERLRARNQILKSTGFLEPGVQPINTFGVAERKGMQAMAAGGLSQALQPRASVDRPAAAAPAVIAAIETA